MTHILLFHSPWCVLFLSARSWNRNSARAFQLAAYVHDVFVICSCAFSFPFLMKFVFIVKHPSQGTFVEEEWVTSQNNAALANDLLPFS